LRIHWKSLSLEEGFGRQPQEGDASTGKGEKDGGPAASLPLSVSAFVVGNMVTAHCTGTPSDAAVDWLAKAEDFVAMVIARYLSQFFVHLRNLLGAVTLGVILLLLTVMLYPFHPQSLLLAYGGVLLAAVVGVIVYIFVMINRDEVMSNLAGSTPNRFTPDSTFFREMCQFVLPAVAILVVQFSVVSSSIRWLLEPLLRVIH
jgi:hypothetical protein